MPYMHKDRKSGALLFTPTPDEQLLLNLKRDVDTQSAMLKRVEELLPVLNDPEVLKAISNAKAAKFANKSDMRTGVNESGIGVNKCERA